jgi:D-tagatose-1,6-bisphosphate aldolase subunit GatZ/KbaZ
MQSHDNSRLSVPEGLGAEPSECRIRALIHEAAGRPLLCVGCVSPTAIEATLRAAEETGTAAILIASRNQIEAPEIGRGYASPFSQRPLMSLIQAMKSKRSAATPVLTCRDHGGPWQRYDERSHTLPPEAALDRARRSLESDVYAGIRYLHIDMSAAHGSLSDDQIIEATVTLMGACEEAASQSLHGDLEYEVSTEHADGGTSTIAGIDSFLEPLLALLERRRLPRPTTVVIRCGTVCREGHNAGGFNADVAMRLSAHVHSAFDILVKEHNGDYLSKQELAQHVGSGIDLFNIGPSVGDAETTGMLHLADLEAAAAPASARSNFRQRLQAAVHAVAPVHIWYPESACGDPTQSDAILRACGHYVFNEPDVILAREALLTNCILFGVDEAPAELVLRQVQQLVSAIVTQLRQMTA